MNVQQPASPASSQSPNEAIDLIYDHFGIFNLLIIPLITLPFWIAFHREGRYRQQGMNLAEATTAVAFTGCQNLIVSILSLPFITAQSISLVTAIGYVVVGPLFLLTAWQMSGIGLWRFVWRTLVFLLMFLLMIVTVFVLLSFAIVLAYDMR